MKVPFWSVRLLARASLCALLGAVLLLSVYPLRAQEPAPTLPDDPPQIPLRDEAPGPVSAVAADPADWTPAAETAYPPAALMAPEANGRVYTPLVVGGSTFATLPPSPLPVLVNGFFDESGGWTYLRGGQPSDLTWPVNSSQLGAFGISTQPRLLWLGGGSIINGVFVPEPPHEVRQTVRLPADYAVRLQFDYLPQSAETVCGNDTAGLYANGVLLSPRFRLCNEPGAPTNTWREATVDLGPLRGQDVTLEFRMTVDGQLNSNLWVDNLELCGDHSGLRASQQCPFPGWQEVGFGSARAGGISGTSQPSIMPSLAIGQSGRPYAAWAERVNAQGNYQIFVRRWNGVAWEAAGAGAASGSGISGTPGASLDPAIAVARDGRPWVAWSDQTPGASAIYVRRWDGSAWVEAGAGSASGSGISGAGSSIGASLAIAANGTPYVAWTNVRAGGALADIYVRRFNGSFWEEVGAGSASGGGISATAAESRDASLAIAANGIVYVAWSEETAQGEEIYVRRFNGTAWVEAAPGSASGGGVSNTAGRSQAPSLAAAPDGALWLAWFDNSSGDTEIYVRRLVGDVWLLAGSGSASGGGISNNAGSSLDPSLAVARNGRVYVAWRDQSGLNAEIYIKQWTGSAWQSVGPDTASGSGISNTATASTAPTVAVAPDGTPYVLWGETIAGGEIYARRYMP